MYAAMSDENLDKELNAILNEKEKRQQMKEIPGQIALLSERYTSNGGNPDDLVIVVG